MMLLLLLFLCLAQHFTDESSEHLKSAIDVSLHDNCPFNLSQGECDGMSSIRFSVSDTGIGNKPYTCALSHTHTNKIISVASFMAC